jgi:hypothetical protein
LLEKRVPNMFLHGAGTLEVRTRGPPFVTEPASLAVFEDARDMCGSMGGTNVTTRRVPHLH